MISSGFQPKPPQTLSRPTAETKRPGIRARPVLSRFITAFFVLAPSEGLGAHPDANWGKIASLPGGKTENTSQNRTKGDQNRCCCQDYLATHHFLTSLSSQHPSG